MPAPSESTDLFSPTPNPFLGDEKDKLRTRPHKPASRARGSLSKSIQGFRHPFAAGTLISHRVAPVMAEWHSCVHYGSSFVIPKGIDDNMMVQVCRSKVGCAVRIGDDGLMSAV